MLPKNSFFVNPGDLISAIRASGMEPPSAHEIHSRMKRPLRFSVSSNGWLFVSMDGMVATWGSFSGLEDTGECRKLGDISAHARIPNRLSYNAEVASMTAQATAIAEAEDAKNTALARKTWDEARPDESHSFLANRKIRNHGVRVEGRGGREALLIPMRNVAGQIQAVQRIYPSGDGSRFEKRILGPIGGAFCVLGKLEGARAVLVARGYATGATLHEATGLPVVVIFSWSSLPKISDFLAGLGMPVVFCADDDPNGVGEKKAHEAAAAVQDGAVVVPQYLQAGGTNFNDLANSSGNYEVRDQVEAVVGPLVAQGAAAITLARAGLDPLGVRDGNPVVFVRRTHEILHVKARRDSIIRLGRSTVEKLTGKSKIKDFLPDDIDHDQAYDVLHSACSRIGVFDTSSTRGPGIWRLDDGSAYLHAGDKCVRVGGHLYMPNINGFLAAEDASEAVAQAEFCALHSELERKYGGHAATSIVGFIVESIAAGALPWRAHLWFQGSRGSGKTFILRLIARILGSAGRLIDGSSTSAGVRQWLCGSSRAVLVDEAEVNNTSNTVAGLIELARSSSSSTEVVKGSSDGSPNAYPVQSCFAFGSISGARKGAADDTRIMPVELKSSTHISQKLSDDAWLARLGRILAGKILRDLPGMMQAINNCSQREMADDPRRGHTVGTLLGCAQWITGNSALYLDKGVVSEQFEERDEENLLSLITALRVGGGSSITTVGRVVQLYASQDPAAELMLPALEALGVCITTPRGCEPCLFVQNNSAALAKDLGMHNKSWRDQLRRLNGAQDGMARINGRGGQRGVLIPISTVIGGPDSDDVEPTKAVTTPVKPSPVTEIRVTAVARSSTARNDSIMAQLRNIDQLPNPFTSAQGVA